MNPAVNPERDLLELGLEIRRTDRGVNGREARLDCLFCPATDQKRDPTLSVNLENGAWHCHRCNEKGNMYLLRQRLKGGANYVRPAALPRKPAVHIPPAIFPEDGVRRMEGALAMNDGAMDFLKARGLTTETIRRFRLGFAARPHKGSAVSIPFFASGHCYGVKYRLMPPGDAEYKYDREKGYTLPLFNIDALDGECRTAAITEGELDAIAWTQYDLGVPAVSVPDGATANLKDDAAAILERFDEILIAFDQDDKGEEGALKLAERLGAFRCRRLRLPKKDTNECLIAGVTREEMLAAIEQARPCGLSNVRHVSAWREELLASPKPESRGKCTGWTSLDALLGGLRPGEVSLVTAETGAGKTTWTLDLACRQAVNGNAVLIASLEIATRAVARKLVSNVAGALWDTLDQEGREYAVNRLCGMPIFLLDRYGDIAVSDLRDEITFAVRRHGVTLAVIDHLHFALGVRKANEDERILIDHAAHSIQVLALELGIHVLLVMHPAKIRAGEDGKARAPEIGDLKGSSGPAQFADNVIRLVRDQAQPRTVLTLLKVRSELGRPGKVLFGFNPDALRFTDIQVVESGERKQVRVRDVKMLAAGDREDV